MAASLARTVCAAVAMGVVAWSLAVLLSETTIWLAAGVAVAGGAVVYLGATAAMGSGEPRAVWAMVGAGRRLRKD